MIHTIRTVAVGGQESKIDSPIILYRGDREVEVEFTINGSKFTFTNGGNVIKSTNATHGQLVINTPTGENTFSEVTECHDGKVVFVITKEMIDELIEVGFYSFQIRLFDESQVSRVTIPPVLKGIDIRNPIAAEDETNIVDIGLVDYSVVVKDEFEDLSTFLPDGNYNKTEWESKDVISGAKLNKIEDALYNINSNMEATDLALSNRVDYINRNIYSEIDKLGDEMKSEVEGLERNLNKSVGCLKIDVNNSLDVVIENISDVNDKLGDKMDRNAILTMANMGQDVKEAMTGGSVAVVGEDAILAENIVDKQVTANKIANTTPCKNIIDKNAMRYGYYYEGGTGKIIEGSSLYGLNCITPLIPCIPGTNFYRYGGEPDGFVNTVFFDSSKTYIGRVEGISSTAFVVMENASYMAFSFISDFIDSVMVHEGTAKATYEKYAVICNDYRVNELGISDVWLSNTEYLDIVRGYNGEYILNVTENDDGSNGLRLYMTHSYGLQTYVKIPAGIYTLTHNTGWIFNYNTNKFTIKTISSYEGYADITEGEILLLRITNREITAGRLKHHIYTWLARYKTELQAFVFRSGNGTSIVQTRGGVNKTDITIRFPTSAQLQFIFDSGRYYNHHMSDEKAELFTIPHNHMLIYNYRKRVISLVTNEPNDEPYLLGFDEFLLAFNIYGTIVDGLLLPYISSTFDLLKTNLLSVYDRYYEWGGCTLDKTDNTFTFTVPLTNNTPWRVYVLRTNITGVDINPKMTYTSYIPEGDPIVDETGETIVDTKATFVLPHNGMLLLNTETNKFYTELMTGGRCISFGGTNDILLLLNIEGQLVGGELARAFNDRILKEYITEKSKYDIGRLKFKFDVDPGESYISSESMVDDELWVFPVSNDEGTNYIKATRYKMDFENNTATEVGSFTHNWGHVNSSAYNPWRDALICGNGSGSYELMGQIFIFENASSFKDRTQVDRSEAVTIDVQEWGYKANVIWGESNMGRGDICYVITNDGQNIRKLQLGMGSNNLGNGIILSDKTDYQFNGTYQVLGTWNLPKIDVVQGSNYENGALYIGLGHNTAWYTKNYLNDDGSVSYETYQEKFYNADGTQLYCNMQGITVTDKYVIIGLQGGNLSTNQIHVYYR